MSWGSHNSETAGKVALAKKMNCASSWPGLQNTVPRFSPQSTSFFGLLGSPWLGAQAVDCYCYACPDQITRAQSPLTPLVLSFLTFFFSCLSFYFILNSLILSEGDLSCRQLALFESARLGRGVQESRGRSWIDRSARYLHTTDPAGAARREGGARDVLFILYIIVVVDFHLDTTNTLLFSPASLGRAHAADRTGSSGRDLHALTCRFINAFICPGVKVCVSVCRKFTERCW